MVQSKYLKQNGETIYPITSAENIVDLTNVVISGNTATFPDGLIVQWGGETIANNSPVTITFSKAFPHMCFRAIAWGNHMGFANWATINTDSITTTSFRVGQRNGASTSMVIQWLAIGY